MLHAAATAEPAHHLYRWYDADGVLLYVGITNDVPRRVREHWGQSWWTRWAAVVDVDLAESDPDQRVLARRELATIRDERPVFNSAAAGRARDRVLQYLAIRGVDPGSLVDCLPPADPGTGSPLFIGETGQRGRPVEPHEVLRPGEVNPAWPALPSYAPARGDVRWQRLIGDLRAGIADGTYPVGSKLPGLRTLAKDRGLSKTTVIRAFNALEGEGLVRGEAGAGTRVIGTPRRPAVTHEAMLEALADEVAELRGEVAGLRSEVEQLRRGE